ncbi:MAG: hypothetical protein LBE49_06925, partial [Deltaproteobacteria bacterium]|nr:hypothetical protein [Deltaproteobacteria bacterium]
APDSRPGPGPEAEGAKIEGRHGQTSSKQEALKGRRGPAGIQPGLFFAFFDFFDFSALLGKVLLR